MHAVEEVVVVEAVDVEAVDVEAVGAVAVLVAIHVEAQPLAEGSLRGRQPGERRLKGRQPGDQQLGRHRRRDRIHATIVQTIAKAQLTTAKTLLIIGRVTGLMCVRIAGITSMTDGTIITVIVTGQLSPLVLPSVP